MSINKRIFSRSIFKGLGMASAMALAVACGGGGGEAGATADKGAAAPAATAEPAKAVPSGIAMITADQIKLGEKVDEGMAAKGKAIYEVKCQACHSTGNNRVVGPGWKGLLEQRKPEWIMNMILHTDAMLETDPNAQAMLEVCLVRMPNQNLSMDEAREVVEFMRTL